MGALAVWVCAFALATTTRPKPATPAPPSSVSAEAAEAVTALLAGGRYAEGVAALEALVAAHPHDLDQLVRLGVLYARLRRSEAEATFRRALKLDPGAVDALINLGSLELREKHFREAAEHLAAARRLGAHGAPMLIRLAVAHESLAELEPAREAYAAAVSEGAGPEAMFPLARLDNKLGHYEAAAEVLGKALALRPQGPMLWLELGRARDKLGQDDEAEAAYRKSIASDGDAPEPHYALGNLLVKRGKADEGRAELTRFKELSDARDAADHLSGQIATLNREGLKLMDDGRTLDAIDVFEQALGLGPRNGAVHANLGTALLAAGNAKGAVAAFEEAIKLGGDTEAFATWLARARAAAAHAGK